jgi:DNA-binding response OmpR family regulator
MLYFCPALVRGYCLENAPLSVLIVEDEAMIAMMLEEYVESLGYRVSDHAQTLQEAHICVEQGGFDLAILDCNLGSDSVWTVAERLEAKNIPFLISSGMGQGSIPARFLDRPLRDKPYTFGAIEAALKQIVTAI